MNIKDITNPVHRSFVNVPKDSDFPIQNLPFGILKKDGEHRIASAIGDYVVDVAALLDLGYFDGINLDTATVKNEFLNDFIAAGRTVQRNVRMRLFEILKEGSQAEKDRKDFLIPLSEATMSMPVRVGDYTDFYSSIEHATNVGTMFRGKENALKPNWKHLPVGYHGRASSIVISGTDVRRPCGQRKPKTEEVPVYGASQRLDFELEMGFVVGKENPMGSPIPVENAEEYIFGLCLFNDWSARDIQAWEYVPLGPFLGKNFASTISPWIVTMDALEPFRVSSPAQDVEVLPYLKDNRKANFDIDLEVAIEDGNNKKTVICKSNFKYMYWSMAQQLAHHSVGGCNMKIGDICASGTISGKTPDSYGSLLELSWNGSKEIELKSGETRTFLEDNDTLSLKGVCRGAGYQIGFGDCRGKILPAEPQG